MRCGLIGGAEMSQDEACPLPKDGQMRRSDVLIFGFCVGLGSYLIVIAEASTRSIILVLTLLVVLLAAMSTRLWWP
jgi:hypothetical protein